MRPEPELRDGANAAEYAAFLKDHQDWTSEKAARVTGAKAKRAAAAVEALPVPDDLATELAMPFPVAALPTEMRTWALATAEFCQVPITMAATFAIMAAMTAAVRGRVHVIDGWTPPLVSQMMLIASPSERKSPVFRSAFAPVYEWSKNEKRRVIAQRENLMRQIATEETDEKGQAKPAAKGSPEAQRIDDLKQKLKDVKPPRRRIADDITPEEFMRQMDDNDGTQCLVSDEADVFQSFGGRYSNGEPKLGPLLKGWDASQPLMYDRVGSGGGKQRTNIMVDDPRAGIAIAGQYTVLDVLKKNPVYREKGMLARMMYVVLPERTKRRNLTPATVDRAVRLAYNSAILRLFDIDTEEPLKLANCVDYGNGWHIPKWLQAVRERCEEGTLGDGEFFELRDWAGKLVDNLARIAAVLESMGGGGEENLAAMSEFFVVHAKRALHGDSAAPRGGTELDELSRVVAKLSKAFPPKPCIAGSMTSVSKVVSLREMLRVLRMKKQEFEPLVEKLVVAGHLQEAPNDDVGKVGDKALARFFVIISKVGATVSVEHPDDMPNGMPPPPEPDVEFFGDPCEWEIPDV